MLRLHATPDQDAPAVGSAERRRFQRSALTRPVKLRCEKTGRYFSAEGIDASAGGALLRLGTGSHLPVGEPVRLGIAAEENHGLLLSDDLIEARVVRCLGHPDARYVAVQFEVPVFLSEAG